MRFILGFFHHAAVKGQPRQFAVKIAVTAHGLIGQLIWAILHIWHLRHSN
jgi:hypothetical protein